ncbi:MAG: NAD-binding oxidoreductase [Archangium sp.]|nr:NAD-binding oxidoreductase [Archangium sp.]
MSAWHRAQVVERRPVSRAVFTVRLEVPPEVATSAQRPGQYVRVSVDGEAMSYFVLASPPGSTVFELLVREGSAVADALRVEPWVNVGLAEGRGFPLEQVTERQLLLIGTGTGVAALRSVLRAKRYPAGRVHLLHGIRSPDELPYADEHDAWRADGVRVTVTATLPNSAWTGQVGRVQDHLALLPARDAVAFVCGHVEMESEVSRALLSAGAAGVYVNHE